MLFFSCSQCRNCGTNSTDPLCADCCESLTAMECQRPIACPLNICHLISPICYASRVGAIIRNCKRMNSIADAGAIEFYTRIVAQREMKLLDWDFIIPIPPHPDSLRKRGFDLPLKIAQSISRESRGHGLHRRERMALAWAPFRKFRPQKFFQRDKRQQILKDCFRASRLQLGGCSVLLVDDVICSGATLLQAAIALEPLEPARIEAFCLAHAHQSDKTQT